MEAGQLKSEVATPGQPGNHQPGMEAGRMSAFSSVQGFSEHLRQLTGPIQMCQDAARHATSHLVHCLDTSGKIAACQQACDGGHDAVQLQPEPLVLAGALSFAKEQVCRVAASYISSLHASHHTCLTNIDTQFHQSMAQHRLSIAKESATLEAQCQGVANHKAAVNAAYEKLDDQLRAMCQPLAAERKRLQAHARACQNDVMRTRALLESQEAALARADAALEVLEAKASKAVERFQGPAQELIADQKEVAKQESELEALADQLSLRCQELDAQIQRHESIMAVFRDQGRVLAHDIKLLAEMQSAASLEGVSKAAQALKQLSDADEKANTRADGEDGPCSPRTQLQSDLARLRYLHASQLLFSAQQTPTETTTTPTTPASDQTEQRNELRELLELASKCGVDVREADLRPGWAWTHVSSAVHSSQQSFPNSQAPASAGSADDFGSGAGWHSIPTHLSPVAPRAQPPTDIANANTCDNIDLSDTSSYKEHAPPAINTEGTDVTPLKKSRRRGMQMSPLAHALAVRSFTSTPSSPSNCSPAVSSPKQDALSLHLSQFDGPVDTRSHVVTAAQTFLGHTLAGGSHSPADLSLPDTPQSYSSDHLSIDEVLPSVEMEDAMASRARIMLTPNKDEGKNRWASVRLPPRSSGAAGRLKDLLMGIADGKIREETDWLENDLFELEDDQTVGSSMNGIDTPHALDTAMQYSCDETSPVTSPMGTQPLVMSMATV